MKPPTCRGCPLEVVGDGFLQPEHGSRPVVLVGEALGETEARTGSAFVGMAGATAQDLIQRAGYERDQFGWVNAVWCRPPKNELEGKPYELRAVEQCGRKHLMPWLRELEAKVVVPMGNVALSALVGEKGIQNRRGYPEWHADLGCWMLPTVHPSFIQQGNFEYGTVFIHDLRRAVTIAEEGWRPGRVQYILDPPASVVLTWAQRYREANLLLAYDIETPRKTEDEEELELVGVQGEILRVSFAWRPYEAISFPWRAEYMAAIRLLLGGPGPKLAWNMKFDNPRVRAAGVEIGGVVRDGMVAWHVLHSDLRQALGFAATFLCPDQPRWKHLGRTAPAFYNAADSDVTLRAFIQTEAALREAGLWDCYERHVLALDPIKVAMSAAGMPIDPARRLAAAVEVTALQAETLGKLQEVVPEAVRRRHPKQGYVRAPKVLEGLVEHEFKVQVKVCSRCGAEGMTRCHVKLKKAGNPCEGAELVVAARVKRRWAKTLPFVPSPPQVMAYIRHAGHRVSAKKGSATTDEAAIRGLALRYGADPFYPLLLKQRGVQKLGGTYIGWVGEDGKIEGGLPVGADGRVHTTFTDAPSTLRWASQDPNMQNIPRGDTPLGKAVRKMFVAPEGCGFWSVDFSGIEAVLMGYFANSPRYVRLAKLDVHSFFLAYVLEAEGILLNGDMPDPLWPDDKLKEALGQIKLRWKDKRKVVKPLVHGGNFLLGPFKAQEMLFKDFGLVLPVKDIRRIYGLYYELFPDIRRFQVGLCRQVDGTRDADVQAGWRGAGVSYIRNPFGFLHRFHRVLQWERVGGRWQSSLGAGAAKAVAFLPQSTAAGIGKEAILGLGEETRRTLRLYAHDELLGEAPSRELDGHVQAAKAVMEAPIKSLPLDPAWGMGEYLTLGTEAQVGRSWGEMG